MATASRGGMSGQPHRWAVRTGCEPLAPVIVPQTLFVGCEEVACAGTTSRPERRGGRMRARRSVDSPVLLERGLLLVEQSALVLLDPASGEEFDRPELGDARITQVTPTGRGTYIVTAANGLLRSAERRAAA